MAWHVGVVGVGPAPPAGLGGIKFFAGVKYEMVDHSGSGGWYMEAIEVLYFHRAAGHPGALSPVVAAAPVGNPALGVTYLPEAGFYDLSWRFEFGLTGGNTVWDIEALMLQEDAATGQADDPWNAWITPAQEAAGAGSTGYFSMSRHTISDGAIYMDNWVNQNSGSGDWTADSAGVLDMVCFEVDA